MTGKPGLVLAAWLALAGACAGDEHAACLYTGHDWYALSADELRSIAARCTARSFATLNYQRAYYHDLLAENAVASGLIRYPGRENRPDLESFGMHMLLIELLASLYFPSLPDRVAFLNAEYEIRNDIAELWLRGYGTLAARLAEQHSNR